MSERDEQLQDVQTDVDIGGDVQTDTDIGRDTAAGDDAEVETVIDETLADSQQVSDDNGIRDRLSSPVSKRGLAIALVLSVVCMLAFGLVLPLGQLLGLFVGGFVYGLATERRRYAELLFSGAVAGGTWAFVGKIGLAIVAGMNILPLVLVGLVAGGGLALLGHYFGRDLRDGLTRDI